MKRTKACRYFLLTLGICFGTLAEAADLNVPDPFTQPQYAINAASANDRVVITRAGQYQPFNLNKAIIVTKADNLSVSDVSIVAGSSDDYAVEITADWGKVEGLTLIGGSNLIGIVNIASKSEVKNCILQDNGHNPSSYGVYLGGGAKLRGCTVTMTNGDPAAVRISGSNGTYPDSVLDNSFYLTVGSLGSGEISLNVVDGTYEVISGNKITFMNTGSYRAEGIHAVSDYCRVTNNTVSGASKAVHMDGDHATIATNLATDCSYGVYVVTSNYLDINHNTIVRSSCSASTYGIWIDGTSSMTYSIQNNLVENSAMGFNFGRTPEVTWTISHNAYWTDSAGSCGSGSNQTLSTSQLKSDLEPLFCASHEAPVGEYTQRIDSGTAPGNNGWGEVVGAFDVECAWGTLAINTTVPANTAVLGLEDITVATGRTLTVKEGVTFKLDEDDNSGGGDDVAENELIVCGRLKVDGTAQNPAMFTSSRSSPAEGDWTAIVVATGGVAKIDHANVQYAEDGVRGTYQADSTTVSNSTFQNNELDDITAAGDNSHYVTISDNTVTASGGIGISVYASKATVSGNAVTCNSSTVYGMELGAQNDQVVSSNTVQSASMGSALRIGTNANTTPAIRNNTLSNSKFGLECVSSKAVVGDTTYTNTITGNTTGVLADGSNAKPKLRFNDISSNGTGVSAKSGSDPDMGTSNNPGKNKFLSNSTYCINNRNTSGTLTAKENYFGNPGGCPTPACWTGSVDVSNWLCAAPFDVAVPMAALPVDPRGFRILGIAPNPTRAGARIQFALASGATSVRVNVFDISGRLVKTLEPKEMGMGTSEIIWDGHDQKGGEVRTGVYFVRASGHGISPQSIKLLVVR